MGNCPKCGSIVERTVTEQYGLKELVFYCPNCDLVIVNEDDLKKELEGSKP